MHEVMGAEGHVMQSRAMFPCFSSLRMRGFMQVKSTGCIRYWIDGTFWYFYYSLCRFPFSSISFSGSFYCYFLDQNKEWLWAGVYPDRDNKGSRRQGLLCLGKIYVMRIEEILLNVFYCTVIQFSLSAIALQQLKCKTQRWIIPGKG